MRSAADRMHTRTPPTPLSPTYTPKIEVTHPNVPDGSQEQLVDKRTRSPPYHGQDNPVFTFDTASLFSRAPSRVDPIIPAAEPTALRTLPPLRRGSYSPFMPATDKDSLTVPAFGVRRQSLSSSWGRENSLGAGLLASPKRLLKPLQSISIDNVTSDFRSQAVPSPSALSTKSMWSTSDLLGTPTPQPDMDAMSKSSSELLTIPSSSFCTSSLSNVSGSLGERMHELVRAFSSRTQRCKERLSQPPTPSSTSSYDAKSVSAVEDQPQPRVIRLGSFIPMGSRTSDAFSDPDQGFVGVGHCRFKLPRWCKRLRFPETMESYSKLYVTWLFVVMMAYVYNSTVIPLRGVFPYQTRSNWRYWLAADYFCDFIYLVDVVVFKTRLRFTENGVVETDFHQTKKHYVKKWIFKLDLMSMLPLDLFYLTTDQPWLRRFVWLRLPRMLKIQTFWEFYARCDQAAKSSAHAVRIVKTMTYMLYLIHIETCGYYAVSEYEGLNSNGWVYNNQGNAYIRCFYLATKTATSIGNNPKPTNTLEYMFMTLYWLSGVFVFALLIGQIRDIVEAAGQVKENYRKKMDSALHYMQSINISDNTQDRARKWFQYNWEQSKTIDERSLVTALPKKLQTDLAINVHFNTLIKVQLFQDCERNLLYDLVLKLKPNLFLPGDYVCQKGEVGKEMYIVSQGQVEVVGGENKDVVLATLSEGSVFGEISLLAMSGRGNRRTADVRSSGYTNVFTLSKIDFEEAMNEYPEAQKLLRKRAKKLLKENARKVEKKTPKVEAEEIIKTPNDTPKMVKTVIQVLNPQSTTAQKLGTSLKRTSNSSDTHHLQVPGPLPKGPRHQDHSRNNMAFDFSDEQIKPSIKTESYDDDNNDDIDNDEEVLVIERIEQPLPDNSDRDEDNLLHDVEDDGQGTGLAGHLMDRAEEENFEKTFFDDVMSELRAQDVVEREGSLAGQTVIGERGSPAQQEEIVSHSSLNETDQSELGRRSIVDEETVQSGTVTEETTEAGSVQRELQAGRETEERTGSPGQITAEQDRQRARKASTDSTTRPQSVGGSEGMRKCSGNEQGGSPYKRTAKRSEVIDGKPARESGEIEGSQSRRGTPDNSSKALNASVHRCTSTEPNAEDEGSEGGRHDDQYQGEGHPPLPRQTAGKVVTVGIGSISGQDMPAVSTSGRLRKVSTVSLPQLQAEDADLTLVQECPTNSSDNPISGPHHSTTLMEAATAGHSHGQWNGVPSPRSSTGSPSPVPAQNQITCAVEVHREKTITPTPMMQMTEQLGTSTTTTTATTAVTTTAAAPTTRSANSAASRSLSLLPHELHHMRETIL